MKRGKILFLQIAIYVIGAVVFSLCIFALPPLASSAAEMYPEYAYLQYPVLIGLYVTVIPFCFALYQALKLISYITQNNPFSVPAVKALGLIKYSAMTIGVLYITGMIVLGTQNALHPGIAIIGLVIFFASMAIMAFSDVLQELLKNVLKMKTENDLTI
ncbi:MAG: DUF2975 domain-containing protein [Bacillaceae bacterium]|nr:DUF2975 domain-containing protein [Bacillaceae bacterium]